MSYEVAVSGEFIISPELSRKDEKLLSEVIESRHPIHGDHCPWEIGEAGDSIIPTGHETKRSIPEWLRTIGTWLLEHGYKLNGEATWEALHRAEDKGKLVVKDGAVSVYKGKIVYELEETEEGDTDGLRP